MNLSDLPYPLRLCAEVLHYSIFINKTTQELKCGELKRRIEDIFGAKLVEEAFQVLSGEFNPTNAQVDRAGASDAGQAQTTPAAGSGPTTLLGGMPEKAE